MDTIKFKDGMKMLSLVAEIIGDYNPSPKKVYLVLAYQRNQMRSDLLEYFCDDPEDAKFLYKSDPPYDLLFDWDFDYLSLAEAASSKPAFYDHMALLNFVAHVMNEASPSRKQIDYLLGFKKPNLNEILRRYIRDFGGNDSSADDEGVSGEVYQMGVDYSKPVHKFVAEAGFYLVDKGISQRHFRVNPVPKKSLVRVQLYPYEGSLAEARTIAQEKKLALAGILEILAFASKYPNAQRRQGIVEIRDAWPRPTGNHFIYLSAKNGRRRGKVVAESEEIRGSILLLA